MTTQIRGPANKKAKLDNDASGISTPTPATAAVPTYSAAQWGTSQIPIDPILQQQSHQQHMAQQQQQQKLQQGQQPHPMMAFQYSPFPAGHYPPPGAYSHPHFQQYQIPQPQTPSAPTMPSAPVTARPAPQQPPEVDTTDIATLNDALGSAGVDLRAEEETLQRSHDHHQAYRTQEDRTRRQPNSPAFDARLLGATMREIGTRHKVNKIPEDTINYLALALRFRLQGLVKSMSAAAKHRKDTQYDRKPSLYDDGTPMWSVVVRRDVRKQLEAIEKAEKDEEMKVRKERKERADAAAAQATAASAPAGPTDGAPADDPMDGSTPAKKSKKKKDGPGVTAKNMSEDVAKRMSNATATQAAGLGRGKYAWMNAGSVSTPSSKLKAAAAGSNASGPTTTAPQVNTSTSWSKPYVSSSKPTEPVVVGEDIRQTITLRDALFVLERERGHGAGRGAARGWA